MKKWLAALLALCLMLSMVPAALAEEVSQAVDAPVAEVELELGEAEAVLPDAPQEAEPAEAEPAEADEPAASPSGWRQINNWWYMFENDGSPSQGYMSIIFNTNQDGTYFFGSNGAVLTGWQFDKVNSRWHFFDPDPDQYGYVGKEKSGWIWDKKSRHWYYCKGIYGMLTGWQEIDGKWYNFKNNGVMRTYWQKIGSYWYYFGKDGAMRTYWQNIDGYWYYFGKDGAMRTYWQEIDGHWYYFGKDGAMRTGWQLIDGYWYYFKASGVMVTDWQKIDGKWYHFSATGAMQTGWLKLGGKWYYLGSNGVMVTGRQTISGVYYYFDPNGVLQENNNYDRSKDLAPYIGTNIYTLGNKLGLKVTTPGSAPDHIIENSSLYIFSYGENNFAIDIIEIKGSSPYNICGVTYGMDAAAARAALKSAGAVYTRTSYGTEYYRYSGGTEITYLIKNGKVASIEISRP